MLTKHLHPLPEAGNYTILNDLIENQVLRGNTAIKDRFPDGLDWHEDYAGVFIAQ